MEELADDRDFSDFDEDEEEEEEVQETEDELGTKLLKASARGDMETVEIYLSK
jgi:hypothetical protein